MTILSIVVPVLGRPKAAEPFMSSLNSTIHDDCEVCVVASPHDTATVRAWERAGDVRIITSKFPQFPPKVQLAYDQTDSPWLLIVGDDVRFHDGWWPAFLHAGDDSTGLISTNDLGNPFVLAGEHATHPIMRRAWVHDFGASWDGPGHIVHEGYLHAWVDAEWTARAKEDDVFCYAPECVIEHLHPTWSKAEVDYTYRIGLATYERDRRRFQKRWETFHRG